MRLVQTFRRELARDRRGSMTVLAAGGMTVLMGCLAFAVDLGSIHLDERRLQGIADAAAIAAADDLGRAQAAADRALTVSDSPTVLAATVTTGNYHPDPAIAVDQRFTPSTAAPDAARVVVTSQTPLFFGRWLLGRPTVTISRTATAARANLAAFSIGSRLAALDGGIANALLSALVGGRVSLTVMDYNGLIGADVDLFSFADALATELGVSAAGFDQIMRGDVKLPVALRAVARTLEQANRASEGAAVRLVAANAANVTVPLGRLIDLGTHGRAPRPGGPAEIKVAAFDLVRAMAEVAGGARQVRLDLGAGVPGLAATRIWLAIGDRPADSPWLTMTAGGQPVVRTVQMRLYVETDIAANPALRALGINGISLPLLVDVAQAEGKLSDIRCSRSAGATVTLLARPSVGEAVIAAIDRNRLDNFRTPMARGKATLASALLISVTGQASVALGGATWQSVSFSATDIAERKVRKVATGDIATSVAASLIRDIDLEVRALGIGIDVGGVTGLVGALLTPVAGPLDGVLNSLTGLLGVRLGEAHLRVNGVRCGQSALVA